MNIIRSLYVSIIITVNIAASLRAEDAKLNEAELFNQCDQIIQWNNEVIIPDSKEYEFENEMGAYLNGKTRMLEARMKQFEVWRLCGLATIAKRQQTAMQSLGANGAEFYRVTATAKAKTNGERVQDGYRFYCGKGKVTRIVKIQDFTHPGLPQDSTWKLVLGVYSYTPTAFGSEYFRLNQVKPEPEYKFRALVSENPFTGKYRVKSFDWGHIQDDGWESDNISKGTTYNYTFETEQKSDNSKEYQTNSQTASAALDSGAKAARTSSATAPTGSRGESIAAFSGAPNGEQPAKRPNNSSFGKVYENIPQADEFEDHHVEYKADLNAVWNAVAAIVDTQKDAILTKDQPSGIIITDLTRHGIIGFPHMDKYCILIEPGNNGSTMVHLKLMVFSVDLDGSKSGVSGSLHSENSQFVARLAKSFIAKINKKLQAPR